MEAKHTETQYLTWFGKTAYIHRRESILFRDRERITTQYMDEEDHFTQTQLTALIAALAVAAMTTRLLPLQLSLSLYSLHILTTLFSVCSALLLPIYRQEWCHQLQLFFNNGGCQPLTSWMGAHDWCNSSCSCCNCQWLLHINGNQPNNHPLCLLLQRMLASCSSSKLTIMRASVAKFAGTRQTFQSP
jgi:hypothetical protein